jgi:hypothetical protein
MLGRSCSCVNLLEYFWWPKVLLAVRMCAFTLRSDRSRVHRFSSKQLILQAVRARRHRSLIWIRERINKNRFGTVIALSAGNIALFFGLNYLCETKNVKSKVRYLLAGKNPMQGSSWGVNAVGSSFLDVSKLFLQVELTRLFMNL